VTVATRLITAALATLLVVGLGTLVAEPGQAAETAAVEAGTGTTSMPNQVLRRGCRSYGYSYSLTTATGDWELDTFLVDRDGRTVSSGVFMSDTEPATGSSAFGLCRSVTRYGKFTIRGMLTVFDGWDQTVSDITPSHVWLHRWRRR
jgi:hypothetical protein